jgi:uncharacterized membrane protein
MHDAARPTTLRRFLMPWQARPVHPVLQRDAKQRDKSLQARIADLITGFAGSMPFVYLHAIWFTVWIAFGVEKYPFGLLTMIVSLEAIFLSTFVMISQNRADAKRQVIADQQWTTVQDEDQQNHQLLDLSNQILALTKDVHAYATSAATAGPSGAGGADGAAPAEAAAQPTAADPDRDQL